MKRSSLYNEIAKILDSNDTNQVTNGEFVINTFSELTQKFGLTDNSETLQRALKRGWKHTNVDTIMRTRWAKDVILISKIKDFGKPMDAFHKYKGFRDYHHCKDLREFFKRELPSLLAAEQKYSRLNSYSMTKFEWIVRPNIVMLNTADGSVGLLGSSTNNVVHLYVDSRFGTTTFNHLLISRLEKFINMSDYFEATKLNDRELEVKRKGSQPEPKPEVTIEPSISDIVEVSKLDPIDAKIAELEAKREENKLKYKALEDELQAMDLADDQLVSDIAILKHAQKLLA